MIGAGHPPATFIDRQIHAIEAEGISVSHLPPINHHPYLTTRLSSFGVTAHFSRELHRVVANADVLHFQWPGHLINFIALARAHGKPVVLSLRGRQINVLPHLPGQAGYVRRLRKLLPQCAAYHCVSADIMEEGERMGLDRARAWVIHTAVDTDFFRPPPVRPNVGPLRISMVGALIWRKGYEHALIALRRLVADGFDVQLTIVGTGEDEARLHYTIGDMALENHVVLKGRLDPAGVRSVLQESHIFLHAGLSEGVANVTIEAMACGLPVVTTDAGGAREAVSDGIEGFIVPTRNTKRMAECLAELASNPAQRERLGQYARRRAVSEFDIRDSGVRFKQMYQTVLGS